MTAKRRQQKRGVWKAWAVQDAEGLDYGLTWNLQHLFTSREGARLYVRDYNRDVDKRQMAVRRVRIEVMK